MKTEQDIDTKTIPTEDEYVQQEANKLSQDANTLFPNWELFGRIKNFGCNASVDEIVNERIILDGTFFDIVCHISKDGTCYNYVRFKQHKQSTPETWIADGYKQTYENFLVSKAQNTQNLEKYNYNLTNQTLSAELVKDTIQRYEKYDVNNDIVLGGKQDIQKLYQKNFDIKKYNKKCFFHITENNRSIGVFIIFDKNDKKYAIICNHTNKDDINKVKEDLRKNYTIINLPRVQSDNHSCSVLNKIFLTEMHKFFVEDKHDINELLNYKDKEDNKGDIALTDKVKTLFPNLYKYQQYNVTQNNLISENFKSNLLITDKYNIIKDKKNPNENKIFNLGLLREGWGMAIDFISQNIENVPLCELEIFMENFEKQCNFFDRVISLQAQNNISKNKDYFANQREAIQKIKQEIINRQQNRKNNGKEKRCDFIFDTTLTSQILGHTTIAISPKFCEYVERYKQYFGDTIYQRSQELSAKKVKIQPLIDKSNYQTETLLHQLGKQPTDNHGSSYVEIDENVGDIIQRVKPFEGNEAIVIGLRKEYQEKYKNTHTQIINNNLTDKNIIGNKISNDDTINKEDHKSKANYTYNIYDSNNSSSEQQKVDFGNINMGSL
ncbi:MAG: hypothetical protein IJT15_01765 [Rickettsiales bacterium]|nr:hypothetical protein [Rickettsiales bacterium]